MCGKTFCINNIECSIYCEACGKYACIKDSFICSYSNHIVCIKEKYNCSSCHREYCKIHIAPNYRNISLEQRSSSKITCETCYFAISSNFYKFLNENNAQLNLPEILEKSGKKVAAVAEVQYKWITFQIPENQKDIRMGENPNYYIFIFKRNFINYTLVVPKQSAAKRIYELLSQNPNGLRKKDLSKDTELMKCLQNKKLLAYELNQMVRKGQISVDRNKRTYIYKSLKPKDIILDESYYKKSYLYAHPTIFNKVINFFKKEVVQSKIIINKPVISFPGEDVKKDTIPECPKCNKTFSTDYNICPYCGEKLIR